MAPEPSSCTGVKPGFFCLIEGLGAKFGACLGCGAGAKWEQWVWRVGNWLSWGSLRLLPPASLCGRAEEALEKCPCQGTGTCCELQDDADVADGQGLLQSLAQALPQHLKMRKTYK